MAFDDQDQQVDLDAWEKRVFEKHGVPEGLRMSIRNQESGGDVNATSPTGVKGRYQVTQKTAANFGLNRDDPWEQPVAAARLLRQGYDDAKRKNPKFSDRQAWLASSASYYAGPDAFDADGNLSAGSKDGLSNPSRYAESIAQKWADFERGSQSAQPALQPEPSTLRKAIVPGRQQTTVRGPMRPSAPNPFALTGPTGFEQAGQQVAARTAQISPEVAAQADRRAARIEAERRRYSQKGVIGQRVEDIGEGLAGVGESAQRGFENVLSATGIRKGLSYTSPSAKAALERGQLAQVHTAQRMGERVQAADSLASKTTRALTSGAVGATTMIPVAMAGGIPAVMAATGLQQDWSDPKAAALNTALSGLPIAAGRAISPAASRVAGRAFTAPVAQEAARRGIEAGAGGVTNVGQYAGTQALLGRPVDPEEALAQGVAGGVLGTAMAPGRRQAAAMARPRSPIDIPVYDDVGDISGYDRVDAPLTPDVVGQGVNRAGDLGATVQRAGDIRPRPRGTAPMPIQNRLASLTPAPDTPATTAMPPLGPTQIPAQPASNPLAILQENANEAKINAAQFEQSGDWESAQREYDVAHKTLVEAQRQMKRVRNQTPEQADALSAIAREISGAALNRNRASRSATVARREQGIAGRQARKSQNAVENAPTADLPAETNPLLKSVVNPEGGIPESAPESPSGLFGQLGRQQAVEQAKPQRGPKDSRQLSAAEYLKRATNGEGVRVSDRGEARVLGAKEAGIIGLTNRASKYAVSDAQVMLDEGGFSLQDGRKFTDPSVTENDVLAFLAESGREGRMNTRDLDQRIEREAAEYYENQPTGEVRLASNRLPRIGDLPPSRMAGLQPERPEIPRETSRPLTVAEQARQAGGSTDDLAILDRLNQRLAVEEPRPYGERTRHGEPGSGGRSFSPYNDLVTNNRGAIDQLRGMNLESPEAGEILARLDDYAERRGIEPHHVENLAAQIKNEQADAARRADEGVGSAPLRDPSTAELRDFYSRPDEAPAPSAPLKPVRNEGLVEGLKSFADDRGNLGVGTSRVRDMLASNSNDDLIDALKWTRGNEPSAHMSRFAGSEIAAELRSRGIPVDEIRWQVETLGDDRVPVQQKEAVSVEPEPQPAARGNVADTIAEDLRRLHAMNPQEIEQALRAAEARRNDDIRNPQMNEVERRMNRDLLKFANERRHEMVRAKQLPAKSPRGPARGERPTAKEAAAPNPLEQDVTILDDGDLAKRIRDAETILNRATALNPARRKKVEEFRDRAILEKDRRQSEIPPEVKAAYKSAEDRMSAASDQMRALRPSASDWMTPDESRIIADRSPVRSQGVEREAAKIRVAAKRKERARTVSHPDPAIDGKPILATTADGRVIVANEGNKSGVSVVKDSLTTEPKPDRKPIKYAIPEEAMPELRKPDSGVSRERGDVFYSQLERVIDQKMPARASSAQVRAMVENPQSGVKADEIKWTGLDDFLRSKSEVTKAEVQGFLKANRVEVREVEKGGSKKEISGNEAVAELKRGEPVFWQATQGGDPIRIYEAESITSPQSAYKDDVDSGIANWVSGNKATKFGQYAIPGAKEGSYRELLLTMPLARAEDVPNYRTYARERGYSDDRVKETWQTDDPLYREWESKNDQRGKPLKPEFKSPHFDEPNILAHLRFNERTDADGNRVMHVEEIQSDWHQAGRKKGYASDGELFRVRKESDGNAYEIYDVKTGDVVGSRWSYEDQAIKEAERFTREDRASSVPDAPFKKTWHELAFKRALRYAAENDYDRMTWTTGEQQAERFDLSKQVKEIEYIKHGDQYELGVTSINGDGVKLPKDRFTADELEDVVGKEIAQKIVNGEGKKYRGHDGYSLDGLDLKVGGEGMKGFYDQILPAFANKYAKKWGARVGEAKIEISANTDRTGAFPKTESVHSIDITPAMRESVMGGQPMFQRGNQPLPMPDRVTARDLADNVRAEYRPAANRPGTVYLNDWGLEALNAADYLEFRAGREGAADDRITGGVNYPPEEARQIADHIRERAGRPNFSDEGRKNLETMARQIELAADDGNVSFVPMQGQTMRQARQTIRHEAFHSQQSAVHPDVHELTTPRWLRAQRFGAAIGEELSRRGYSERQHPAEAAAFVASGNWDAFGMNRDDARQFLTDYFDDVTYRHGKEAINKFRAIHPALQEVVEARRGTNEPRFGSPGLGRSIGSAVNRQRGVERPGGSVARSRSSVPSGDAGSVRGQSQTAALRAITPESLRAGQPAQPSTTQSPRRQGLAGIRAEDLRAPGAPPPPTPRSPREPVSGVPTGKDVSGFDYLRSRLSNLNFTGTYERLAGARGREVSEIIRNAQVEIARQPDTERASLVSDLRRQLQPFKAEFRDNGQPGLANWMDAHVDAINDADAAFKGLAGFLRGFHYNTKLRYNPKSAALNSLQPLQTLWPHVTTREFAKLMKDARTPLIRGRVLEIAERESGGQVEEVSKRGRFEAVPKVLRNPFAVVSDTNRVVGHLAGEMFADRMGLTGHAKARMAADWAKKIEYDNSRWDVPPLFSRRLAGVVGQFKSFTVKNLERLHADWKAAPEGSGTGNLARRAKMITGQVVLGGVRSVPGVKQIGGVIVLGALARAFNSAGLDDDDANKAAEAVYFGAPGLIEQDISSSMMILDAPFGNTPAEQAVNYLGGPTLSLIVKAFKEGETMIDAEGGRGSTAGEKRKAAAIRLAKATTPYAKTVEAAADLVQGKRPALKLERKSVPMTNLEVAGKLGMATPLRQSKFYEEKDAYDWQKRVARKLKPAQP